MPLPIATEFADLPDPCRVTLNEPHRLADILTFATGAGIAAAGGWEQIAA